MRAKMSHNILRDLREDDKSFFVVFRAAEAALHPSVI